MPVQTTTGGRIQLARNQMGLSPSQLALRIGVRPKTLDRWENDRSEPRADKIVKLAGLLQVPLAWLLTGDTPQGTDPKPSLPNTTEIAQKLERAITMQRDLAALLIDVSADVARLQREMKEDQDLAA